MKVTAIETQEVEVVKDILCNQCGGSCAPEAMKSDLSESGRLDFYGLIEVEYSTGFYSPALPDGQVHRFSLCEMCLATLMQGFKIPSLAYDEVT